MVVGRPPLTETELRERFEKEMNPTLGWWLMEVEGLRPRRVKAYTWEEARDKVVDNRRELAGFRKKTIKVTGRRLRDA